MTRKLLPIAIFFVLAYMLPLTGRLYLLTSPQILILLLLSVILFLTQPPLSIKESKEKFQSDGFSVWVILLASLLAQIISVVEWAYFKTDHALRFDSITVIGLLLSTCGTIFRIWCIKTLGKYFTAIVQTQQNQQIITIGPYSIVRHPSYLGAYLAITGSAVFLHTLPGFIFSAVIMLAAYCYRIKVEETTLVNEFGSTYTTYQQHTKKLFPFLW